jgi:hypothetical protein
MEDNEPLHFPQEMLDMFAEGEHYDYLARITKINNLNYHSV